MVLLVLLLAGNAGPPKALVVTGEPDPVPALVAGPRELEVLCRALEPSERLRIEGDAVARAEAEDDHENVRDVAVAARYEVVVPAGRLAFAPYETGERRLALADGLLYLERGGRLFEATERGLPVEVSADGAKRILAAQRAGRLELSLVFDLPDEVTCSRGRPRTLPVEPVAWTWRAGGEALARGGSGAERPLVPATGGARPRVSVGEPFEGPAEARRLLESREPALSACYAEALKRAPSLDGVLVADLAPGRPGPAIAADSVGDAPFADCVRKSLEGAGPAGGRAVVPIRFELEVPGAQEPGSAGPAAPVAQPR